jgi:glycosyltransferase involved in cell wall biosynthesis
MKISLCMIVKNEEKYIRMCLENACNLVDEIIIVDTGSTDKTIETIKQFDSKIILIEHKWNNNFSEARNISLKEATGDWILILDADEKLLYDKNKLVNLLENTNYDGFRIPLYNILDKDRILYSSAFCKLFKNNGYTYSGAIHEQLNIGNNLQDIETNVCKVIHYGYLSSTVTQKNKFKRNLDILKSNYKKNPNDAFTCFNLGTTYIMDNQYDKALSYFLKSYNITKNKLPIYYQELVKSIGICLYKLKRYTECLNYLNAILSGKGFEDYVDLQFLLGLCYFEASEYCKSKEAFEKCIEIGEAKNALSVQIGLGSFEAKMMIARILTKQNKVMEASMMYIEAIFDPNNISRTGIEEVKKYLAENKLFEILNELEVLTKKK